MSVSGSVYITEILPVFFVLFHNLPMATFVSNSSSMTITNCNGEEISTMQTTLATSDVVGAQVGKKPENGNSLSALLLTPVVLNFKFDTVMNGSMYRCVYWNFSDP